MKPNRNRHMCQLAHSLIKHQSINHCNNQLQISQRLFLSTSLWALFFGKPKVTHSPTKIFNIQLLYTISFLSIHTLFVQAYCIHMYSYGYRLSMSLFWVKFICQKRDKKIKWPKLKINLTAFLFSDCDNIVTIYWKCDMVTAPIPIDSRQKMTKGMTVKH